MQGINLITLLWTQDGQRLPCDFRIYNREQDHLTKNDHFAAMLESAQQRGFSPELVIFDSWYARLDNLKQVRRYVWHRFTRLKANLLVSVEGNRTNQAVSQWHIPPRGRKMHLKENGWVKVFKTVATDGHEEYWATSQLGMSLEDAAFYAADAWQIEVYHQGITQFAGVERGQFRLERAQRNHIGLAIRAFLRLEVYRIRAQVSWFDAKTALIREAIRKYPQSPIYVLHPTA